MQEKICIKCNTLKPLKDFSNRGKGKNNFAATDAAYWNEKKSTCKDCDAEYAREFRRINPGYRGSGKNTRYPQEERMIISAIRLRLNVCKSTFRKRNSGVCESDLTEDYLYDLYKQQEGNCYYSGTKMRTEKKHPETLSIDKIVPKLGYVKGNVQWVCWAVNRAKGDMTERDFLSMCRAITGRRNDHPAREYSQVAGSAQLLVRG